MKHEHEDGSECTATHLPIHSGMPVLVRLINGQDVMGIVWAPQEDDSPMFIETPIVLMSRPPYYSAWVPMSDSSVFPVTGQHVVFVAPLSKELTDKYMVWVDLLYKKLTDIEEEAVETPIDLKAGEEPTAEQKAKMDFLVHSFTAKGKPN